MVVDTLYSFIQDQTIILDDWKWSSVLFSYLICLVISEGGHLCVTIDCKIRTSFQNAIFYIDVAIVMFPTYPNDIPRVYLKKKPSKYRRLS